MSPERWQQIEEIYYSALERASEERAAFLDEACGGDAELRREVESLLQHGDSEEALVDRPAWEAAGDLLDTHTMDPADDLVGHCISHYEILQRLGQGGMGVVYKAGDTKLRRLVALKFLPPQLSGNPEFRERFLTEARAAAALSHANICTVHEIHDEGDRAFLEMEYVEGQTLSDRVKEGPLEPNEAVAIALQVAEALEEAHRGGVIHRDIKSPNVMVTAKGQAKVMDFGLARVRGETLHTKPGTLLGTVAYMSPEQARGGARRCADRHLVSGGGLLRDVGRPEALQGRQRSIGALRDPEQGAHAAQGGTTRSAAGVVSDR